MLKATASLFGAVVIIASVSPSPAQSDTDRHVVKVEVRMQTTGQGKDGDTQVLDAIVLRDGRQAASLDCCSSGNSGSDVWDSGSDKTRAFNHLYFPFTRADVLGATVKFGMRPNGKDEWQFISTLIVTYDVGSQDVFGFGEIDLQSRNVYTDRQFTIPPP